ncbi:MAG: hypothetical protein K2Y31_16395 [Burkholderiales bacterium]|jgi:uncharacterized protein (UPF0332 family)|nr:hypothetical protein [Burkholderiales bacterium]
MAVTPEDFLAQAVKQLASASTDPDYRTVITNAYYGAYHSVVKLEERFPHRSLAVVKNAGSHEALLVRLERPNPNLDYGLRVLSSELAGQMRIVKALRELASYEPDQDVRVDQAEQAILIAKDILVECARAHKKIP